MKDGKEFRCINFTRNGEEDRQFKIKDGRSVITFRRKGEESEGE